MSEIDDLIEYADGEFGVKLMIEDRPNSDTFNELFGNGNICICQDDCLWKRFIPETNACEGCEWYVEEFDYR